VAGPDLIDKRGQPADLAADLIELGLGAGCTLRIGLEGHELSAAPPSATHLKHEVAPVSKILERPAGLLEALAQSLGDVLHDRGLVEAPVVALGRHGA
jgi:hypothetical protein